MVLIMTCCPLFILIENTASFLGQTTISTDYSFNVLLVTSNFLVKTTVLSIFLPISTILKPRFFSRAKLHPSLHPSDRRIPRARKSHHPHRTEQFAQAKHPQKGGRNGQTRLSSSGFLRIFLRFERDFMNCEVCVRIYILKIL